MSTCQFCNKEFHNNFNLKRHQKSCKDILKHENEVLKKSLEEKNKIIQTLQEEIGQLKTENMRCKFRFKQFLAQEICEYLAFYHFSKGFAHYQYFPH